MSTQNLIEKFIYSCSHDLKAPVASIQGLVRIADYYPHHEEIHKCLEMIETCTHEMTKRISALQEYLMNTQHHVRFEQLNPLEVIEEVKSEFKNQLDASKIELFIQLEAPRSWNMDRESALKILRHLISNCIAFHDQEKTERWIVVRVKSTELGSALEVSDNGKGIPLDQQARVFEIFVRATENSIGLGTGLFLAKSLVEKMNGSISCTSELHAGTTILVSIPNHLHPGEERDLEYVQLKTPAKEGSSKLTCFMNDDSPSIAERLIK